MFRGGLPLSMRWQDVTLGVGKLAENVLRYIRRHRLLKAGDRVGAAVSGGIDSVALLRLLVDLRQEIGLVLSVVHFNHNLRGAASEADEQFVAQLAQNHELELHCGRGDVAQHAVTPAPKYRGCGPATSLPIFSKSHAASAAELHRYRAHPG